MLIHPPPVLSSGKVIQSRVKYRSEASKERISDRRKNSHFFLRFRVNIYTATKAPFDRLFPRSPSVILSLSDK